MTTATFTPPPIQRMADDLTRDTGTTPTLTRTGPLHYLLALTSDRVALTITYRRNARGRWAWNASTLHIDNQPHALAKGYSDFLRIWHNPDQANTPQGKPANHPTLTPVPDGTELPPVIALLADRLANRPDNDTLTTYAAATPDGYTFVVTGPRGRIDINYTQRGTTDWGWALDPRQPFLMSNADGHDISDQFAGDIEAALKHFLNAPTTEPVTTPRIGQQTRRAAATNSVTVRRHAVIRV